MIAGHYRLGRRTVLEAKHDKSKARLKHGSIGYRKMAEGFLTRTTQKEGKDTNDRPRAAPFNPPAYQAILKSVLSVLSVAKNLIGGAAQPTARFLATDNTDSTDFMAVSKAGRIQ